MAIIDFPNIHGMLENTVTAKPEQTAYRWFAEDGESLQSVSWREFHREVHQVARALMALGVARGDKVNILSYTCYRWILSDLGITTCGAVTVGIYQSNLAKDCQYIINHSDAVVIFVENQAQLDKLLEIRPEIPAVRKVILFTGSYRDDWVMPFDSFLKLGADISYEAMAERIAAVAPDDPAGIVYTSGTTGEPRGAVLTHDNLTFTSQSARECLDIREEDVTFLFLPLAHVFAQICVNLALLTGSVTVIARGIDTLRDDLDSARPHWFASVPRIYEKVYAREVSDAETGGGLPLKIFHWACRAGEAVSDCKLANRPVPMVLRLQYALATRLVFNRLQADLGGRVRWCISGAAPLDPSIARFFHAAGVLILEGLGMSENTSFTNVNRVDNYRFGWVGLPGPGIEQKLDADDEVLFRGRNVMKEYYKMPEETAATIDADGWQRSGDLGEIDAEGFLRITGRKKDIIITAGGTNVAPSAIEGFVATSRYINQVCLIGDRRQYLTALITLDPENVGEYARQKGIAFVRVDDLITHPAIIDLVDREVAEKNKDLASFQQIKKFALVPEFTVENGLITPTFKIKRNIVRERFKVQIEAMYADE
ncbi:MAG: AMP-dependent synthetase/ligase [Desulfosudaceae bacterium]